MENDKLVRMSDVKTAVGVLALKYDNMICGDVRRCVENIPAVDAEEVRHGEWIWDGYVYDAPWECSECRKLNDIASNYCPHCGARMDGEAGGA